MRVLVDTNVLIRLFQPSNPSSPIAASAIQELKKHEFEVVMVPQNLYELWVIATRAVSLNGFGMPVSDTSLLQDKCMQQFRLLRDERGIFDQRSQIVTSNQVIGKSAHDARLVAAKHAASKVESKNADRDPPRVPEGDSGSKFIYAQRICPKPGPSVWGIVLPSY